MEPTDLLLEAGQPTATTPFDHTARGPGPASQPTQPTEDDSEPPFSSRKRPASPSYEQGSDTKRFREDTEANMVGESSSSKCGACCHGSALTKGINGQALLDELEQELQCGCCSELLYKPVVVLPCQHYFCGSCVTMWIKNGGTNCPACRSISTTVMPSRPLQIMVDVLLRAAPHKIRAEGERMQADEVYASGKSLRIPIPREPSPEPQIPTGISLEYARPCPHCARGNPFGWMCPQPIIDPSATTGSDPVPGVWKLENGTPPGHGYCGNCESLLALSAPTTTKCDFCQVSFCGINVQNRCNALPLLSQQPQTLTDLGDMLQSPEVYECFSGNCVEVEFMIDYLQEHRRTPRYLYKEIVAHLKSSPSGFVPLIQLDLFTDIHAIPGEVDSDPAAPRNSICRLCATEVLLWGLRDWWIRERKKLADEGRLPESLKNRPDCQEGEMCTRQNDMIHAKEFNHIIMPTDYQELEGQNETTTDFNNLALTPHHTHIMTSHLLNGQAHEGGSGLTLPSLAELGFAMPPIPMSNIPTLPLNLPLLGGGGTNVGVQPSSTGSFNMPQFFSSQNAMFTMSSLGSVTSNTISFAMPAVLQAIQTDHGLNANEDGIDAGHSHSEGSGVHIMQVQQHNRGQTRNEYDGDIDGMGPSESEMASQEAVEAQLLNFEADNAFSMGSSNINSSHSSGLEPFGMTEDEKLEYPIMDNLKQEGNLNNGLMKFMMDERFHHATSSSMGSTNIAQAHSQQSYSHSMMGGVGSSSSGPGHDGVAMIPPADTIRALRNVVFGRSNMESASS